MSRTALEKIDVILIPFQVMCSFTGEVLGFLYQSSILKISRCGILEWVFFHSLCWAFCLIKPGNSGLVILGKLPVFVFFCFLFLELLFVGCGTFLMQPVFFFFWVTSLGDNLFVVVANLFVFYCITFLISSRSLMFSDILFSKK